MKVKTASRLARKLRQEAMWDLEILLADRQAWIDEGY